MAHINEQPVVQINQLGSVTWVDQSQCDFTIQNSAHVWRICISASIHCISNLWLLLSADEQERANRYYREPDKQRFIVSRAGLRILLGKYLSTPSQQIIFEIGENKKPHVKNAGAINLHYNVSHSGDYVLIAFSDSELGVDIEKTDRHLHYSEIMGISFSSEEISYVERSKDPTDSFYTLWTRKEALLKAIGKGIDDSIALVPSLDGYHTISSEKTGSDKSWIVNTFKVAPDHTGSITAAVEKNTFWELVF